MMIEATAMVPEVCMPDYGLQYREQFFCRRRSNRIEL